MGRIETLLRPIFHALVVTHHLFVISRAKTINEAIEKVEAGEIDQRVLDLKNFASVYFTNWNLVIQTAYFGLAVVYDVLQTYSLCPKLRVNIDQLKGLLFISVIFPYTIFVFAMFWVVYNINREWVFPEIWDGYIPNWMNHSLHTWIVVVLLIEMVAANQRIPNSKTAFIALTLFTVVYDTVFFVTYFIYGRFIYGLFHTFSWPGRVFFLISNYLFAVIVMKIGIAIEKFKNSSSRTRLKESKN